MRLQPSAPAANLAGHPEICARPVHGEVIWVRALPVRAELALCILDVQGHIRRRVFAVLLSTVS